ncbi:DUF4157 domain-containing protein [Streptomyces sp. JHA26]|uniref:eCIS core domain-containing protein n=1 Tax=Streptomyces sp. JHA26 TaxID=1917143 RepID=UPI0025B73C27|nr:DUF4157 domain-containing protein [Streptomyces sp. JHA26]
MSGRERPTRPSPAYARGSGEALRPGVRRVMESRLGVDFSTVRIHTDPKSAAMSERLRAAAFTWGSHISFAADTYAPNTHRGDALLVHELVHVAQNRTGRPPAVAASAGGGVSPAEHQAHQAAEGFVAGVPHLLTAPVGSDDVLALADEDWYRGYVEGAVSAEDTKVVHDLGDGLYFSDVEDVANQYGVMRSLEKGASTPHRTVRIRLDPVKMGRVLDLTRESEFMLHYTYRRSKGALSGESYRNLFLNHLRVKNYKIEDFDIFIGPEGVRGGRQMCIRNPTLVKSVVAQWQHLQPSGTGGGGGFRGGEAAPARRDVQTQTSQGGKPPAGKADLAATAKPAPAPVVPVSRLGRHAIGFFKGVVAPMIASGINSYLLAQKDAKYVPERIDRALVDPEVQSRIDDFMDRRRLSISRAQRNGKTMFLTVDIKLVFTNGIQDGLYVRDPLLTEKDVSKWSPPLRMSDEPLVGAETTVGWVTQSLRLQTVEMSRSEELGIQIDELQARARDMAADKKGGGSGETRRREAAAEIARLQQLQSAARETEDKARMAELVHPTVTADARTRAKEQLDIAELLGRLAVASPAVASAPGQLGLPLSGTAPTAPGLLPDAPQGDLVAQAAAVVQAFRRRTDALEAMARAYEARLGTDDAPTPAERQSYFIAEARWRLSVKFAMNKYEDANREEAVKALGELLDRCGPALARTRGYLGG